MESDIKIFLTNLTAYNNGNLMGEWVTLPINGEQMNGILKRIGVEKGEELFITDYDIPFRNMDIGEHENLDDLNYLAARLQEMSSYETDRFTNVLEAGLYNYSSAADYVNLTYNLDCYDMIEVKDEEELGRYLLSEVEMPELPNGTLLSDYVNYEEYGRDSNVNINGRWCSEGIIYQTSYTSEMYKSGSAPEEYQIISREQEHNPIFYGKDAQIRKELPKEFMAAVDKYDRNNDFPVYER